MTAETADHSRGTTSEVAGVEQGLGSKPGHGETDAVDDIDTLPPGLTLLEQLDRRQNEILKQLDSLDDRVVQLMRTLQVERQQRRPSPAAC